MIQHMFKFLALFILCTDISVTLGFSISSSSAPTRSWLLPKHHHRGAHIPSGRRAPTTFTTLAAAGDEAPSATTDDAVAPTKMSSLEEKMKGWEASEDEIRAASLGGLTPKSSGEGGTDGFDIGLYIAFPIIVATSLLFAVFPFIMDKIDVTSVGPPPTV